MLLHISLHSIRTEGLLKLSDRSSICNHLSNSTSNLSSVNRFFTLKLPLLFLLSFPIQVIIKRSFRLCVFLMQWLAVLESMEKPVCKLCFPMLLPQPLQMLFLTSLPLLGIPCHQGRGSVPAPAQPAQCGAGCAQQDGLDARASCPAAASIP